MIRHRYRLELVMPGHTEASEAISDAQVANISEDVTYVVVALCRRTCLSVHCTNDIASLNMSDGQSLHVCVDANGVIVPRVVRSTEEGKAQDTIEDYVLLWKASEEVWDRGSPLRACIGRRLKNAFYNGNELYVYWEDLEDVLCFRPAKDLDTGRMMLYWHMTE